MKPPMPAMFRHLPLLIALLCAANARVGAEEPAKIPWFLADRADAYQKSPREAAMAWFDRARLGMFVHWGVWGKHHAAWAMFNKNIPLEIAVPSQGIWEWSPSGSCASPDALWSMLFSASNNNTDLLLNFGPKPDGSIPEDVAVNFRQLGRRIAKEGYPDLNTKTSLELRHKAGEVDSSEKDKTAR